MGDLNINGNNNVVNNAAGDINQNVATNGNGISAETSFLINVAESLKKFELSDVYHWIFIIKMNGKNISAPKLLEKYKEFNNNFFNKNILTLINIQTTKTTVKEVRYEYLLKEPGVKNYRLETALSFTKSNIQFEYAQYKSDTLRTNFTGDLLPSLLLLYFCKTLYSDNENIDIEITIEASANSMVYFQAMGINYFKIKGSVNTYTLSENKHTIEQRITDFENGTMIDILEKVVEGYSSISISNPFLAIDVKAQDKTLDIIKEFVFKA